MRPEDADWQELKRDIVRSLAAIQDIDVNHAPYTRTSFTASIAGKIERIARHGDVDTVRQALAILREYNSRHKKPCFTARHAVWSYEQIAVDVLAKEDARRNAPVEPAEMEIADGIIISDNVREDRVQVFFPAKPDAATCARMGAHGFRWSRSNGAWQGAPDSEYGLSPQTTLRCRLQACVTFKGREGPK